MELKVGDEVEIKKVVACGPASGLKNLIGKTGTIVEISNVSIFPIVVKINNRKRYFCSKELRRI